MENEETLCRLIESNAARQGGAGEGIEEKDDE